jgi:exonuclease SbcC
LILSDTRQKIHRLTEELTPLEQKESEVKLRHQSKNDELEKLKASREKIGKAEERSSQLKGRIAEAEKSLNGFVEDNDGLHRTIDETLQPEIREFQLVHKPTEKTKAELKQELDSLRKKSTEKQKLKAKVEERKGNFNSILQNKSCPVCERPVDSKDLKDKIRHLEKEESQLEKLIQKMEKDIDGINAIAEELQKYKEAQNQLLIFRTQLKNTKARITKNEKAIEEQKGKISDLNEQLKAAENEIKPLQKVLTQIQDLTKEVDNLQTELTNVGKEIASKDQGIRDLEENEKQYSEQVALKERQLTIRDSLDEHKIWLTDYFTPTVENIEKHVMTSLNQKFNQQFQRWFQILIDDPDLQVRVNEDFSPVIEREGYEQDYATLCGGEKTSVALAYRLALNTTVQEVAIGGGANLLILDEPTDGFSKEQLFKVRDILAELKCPQVILVSHDKELEGFADYVYKVERRDGVSRIIA